MQMNCCYAQTILSGKVSDERGIAIPNANIAILQKNNTIATFTFSGNDGHFTLKWTLTGDSLTIKATHIGFEAARLVIPNKSQSVQLKLKESALKLEEMTVKAPPVILRKDTIDYQVSAFKSGGDRTISDVIKRMPGIEVKENGQILYQGKPIEKYYINGLDLLEGRYNLANENLPADAVRKVQVMENDQPIRILKSKVFSESASINIQLKKVTTTGSARAGTGMNPALLWDVNVTPMTFNRSFQAIASVQSNNAGSDLSRQLNILTRSPAMQAPASMLGIQQLIPPNISPDRWLDNRSHLASLNLLKKSSSQVEVKFGLGIRDEILRQTGGNHTSMFTPEGIVGIDEQISNRSGTSAFNTHLVIEKNTERIYLKNHASGMLGQLTDTGNLHRGQSRSDQQLKTRQMQLQNDLAIIATAGKQLIHINSQTVYSRRPQTLLIRPGVFPVIFNVGKDFQSISQNTIATDFITKNSVSLTRQVSRISVTPALGLDVRNHQFESTISTMAGDSTYVHGHAFQNDLKYVHLTSFVQIGSYYESGKWKVELNLPFRLHAFRVSDLITNNIQTPVRPALEPTFTTRYQVTEYTDLTGGATYTYDFGSPSQVYSGFILRSYRNVQKADGAIPTNRILTGRIGVNYKNPLSLVFFHLAGSVLRINNNLQYRTGIDSTGAAELTYVFNNNVQLSKNVQLGIGKYFGGIKTSLKLNGDAGFSQSRQIVTDREVPVRNSNYRAGLSASTLLTSYFGIDISGSTHFFRNNIADRRTGNSVISQFELGIDFFPGRAHALRLDTERYAARGNGGQRQLYLNLQYRYTFGKRKIDLEIRATNITNTQNYLSIINSAFTVAESSFRLRPRQVMTAVRIPF